MLKKIFADLTKLISEAVLSCTSDCIALSGGLDSSILASYLKKNTKAIVVVTKDFPSSDLVFSQLITKEFGLQLVIKKATIDDLMHSIEQTIKILKNFNNIEIRNSIVLFIAIMTAKENGCTSIITGDGCDELFAGYSFFLKKNDTELQKDLERIWEIMHFPSQQIGKELGMGIESPFLNEKVANYAKSISTDLKVHNENNKKYGKWILRKAYESIIPESILWREKSPMQDGSGTNSLTEFFENSISNETFESKKRSYQKKDKVKINSKESLYYYEIYRKFFDPPHLTGSSTYRCPDCQAVILKNSHFCRMCGSFPI
jgi:asparagine synthase (glutamine-hydrolysing)